MKLVDADLIADCLRDEIAENEDDKSVTGMLAKGVLKHLIRLMEDLPAAQPKRIVGHWIEIGLSTHTYKCSVCGRLLVNITDGKNNVAKNYPYCHCGAKMDGGEQDDR